jgi:hypothetical protein
MPVVATPSTTEAGKMSQDREGMEIDHKSGREVLDVSTFVCRY